MQQAKWRRVGESERQGIQRAGRSEGTKEPGRRGREALNMRTFVHFFHKRVDLIRTNKMLRRMGSIATKKCA